MKHEETRQFSFRLPKSLVDRVERCVSTVHESGLDLTRTEVVRLLLNHALDATQCKLDLLLAPSRRVRRAR